MVDDSHGTGPFAAASHGHNGRLHISEGNVGLVRLIVLCGLELYVLVEPSLLRRRGSVHCSVPGWETMWLGCPQPCQLERAGGPSGKSIALGHRRPWGGGGQVVDGRTVPISIR